MQWSSQFQVEPASGLDLRGDKILLPPSALEQLLAAAPSVASSQRSSSRSASTAFDPYNPHTYAAERQARALDNYQQPVLPHPLTFRLVNPNNGRVVYAGIREFSAVEGQASLSPFLLHALGLVDDAGSELTAISAPSVDEARSSLCITAHAEELAKGTYVKLRPLEAGYDPEDWKSLLEEYLRKNFTTLTRGELLNIPSGRSKGAVEDFQFLIDEFVPQGDGICVVDTDLQVDIEPLNEDQARETVRKIAAKTSTGQASSAQSSEGGRLDLFKALDGHVASGGYVDYELPSWDRSQGISIELSSGLRDNGVELYVSPFSSRQRAKPREDEHVFAEIDGGSTKRLRLAPTNVELEHADSISISIHAPKYDEATELVPRSYNIRVTPYDPSASSSESIGEPPTTQDPSKLRCKNCNQQIAEQSFMLHENFCFRNNVLCPKGCGEVFQKRSPEWDSHWHCQHDAHFGFSRSSQQRHDEVFHTSYSCHKCNFHGTSLLALAHHRTSLCPGKLVLCRFCHLIVPQEGDPDGTPNPEALLSGLTPHELTDGARTTECHMCQRIVRLRDMDTHLKHHNFERLSRSAPRICRNVNCGRTLDGVSKTGDTRAGSRIGQGAGNEVGMCSICFGPLYVSMYDPDGTALRRRVERRYLSQLLTGCGKQHCLNTFCKIGQANAGANGTKFASSAKDVLPMIKPFVDGLNGSTPLHFCVDEGSQARRKLAAMLAAEGQQTPANPGQKQYGFPWCVAALEAEGGKLDAAREWLHSFAPSRDEEK